MTGFADFAFHGYLKALYLVTSAMSIYQATSTILSVILLPLKLNASPKKRHSITAPIFAPTTWRIRTALRLEIREGEIGRVLVPQWDREGSGLADRNLPSQLAKRFVVRCLMSNSTHHAQCLLSLIQKKPCGSTVLWRKCMGVASAPISHRGIKPA